MQQVRSDNLPICYCKNQIDVSFSCVCPFIDNKGVARIFQRGGHTGSYRGYSPDCHLNIVGCLLTNRLTKGGSRAPQDPPPGYALGQQDALGSVTGMGCIMIVNISELQKKMVNCVWCLEA